LFLFEPVITVWQVEEAEVLPERSPAVGNNPGNADGRNADGICEVDGH
jgi:hypothetical protein